MPKLITSPTVIEAAGNKPKRIEEFVGRVNSATEAVSIARMKSPQGWVEPGQTLSVDFELHSDDLAFYGRDRQLTTEAGEFHVWIGGSSQTELRTELRIIPGN